MTEWLGPLIVGAVLFAAGFYIGRQSVLDKLDELGEILNALIEKADAEGEG